MDDDAYQFEWDDEKAELNYRKHGVDFETATEVFEDNFAIYRDDPLASHHGEARFIIIGMASGRVLTVIYTERGPIIRLISARTATRREHDNYYRQNSKE
jgi:uncharacterized protein